MEELSNSNATAALPAISRSRKSLVPTEIIEINSNNNNKATKTPQKKLNSQDECTEELDIQLRELLREKEIVSNTNKTIISFINIIFLAPSRIQ